VAIPIFNHSETIATVVEALAPLGIPCIVVNDGSDAKTQQELARLQEKHAWVSVEHHTRNLGRGAALRTAYRTAFRRGITHLVQIDADGQHAAADIPRFLEAAKSRPDALILGDPIFDDSIPWHRRHGRKLSIAIVWMETLSTVVRDPLCGFRCIPLAPTLEIMDQVRMGDRMNFDPELVIRLVSEGVPVVAVPTAVHYPESGVSHFRIFEDNLRIALTYLRLAFELPWRRLRRGERGERTP
jgi:glycosyltransferase involved in cell wall biosynthesis